MVEHHDLIDMRDALPLEYWREPQGIPVEADNLSFLYIPDYAEHMIVSWQAQQVFNYQRQHAHDGRQVTKMVMITMGGLLPGVLLHDAVSWGADPDMPDVEFGTFGVKFYRGPGQPLAQPRIVQPLSIDVRGQVVAIIEDLADIGRTAKYVQEVLCSPEHGARETLLIATYKKTTTAAFNMELITFGIVPHDTWIISPRERIETMMKRVPYWAAQGLDAAGCRANLVTIGYPSYLLDAWFDRAWARRDLPDHD